VRWIVPCPAKLNLFLAVGPRDSRGYHPLRTIFQAVGIFDSLNITVADIDEVVCDDPLVPVDNTVSRALRLVRELVELPPLRIELQKSIPMQSGLGGGSSDAAGLLRAAGAISGQILPSGELEGIALALGADVPFFLVGGRARADGYGERLTMCPDVEGEWYLIAKPEVGCDTREAFQKLDELTYEWLEFPEDEHIYNDFERVAPSESLDLLERLLFLGSTGAGLTGSGSAVFGRFPSPTEAGAAMEKLKNQGVDNVWFASSISRKGCLRIDREYE
jgi:4-diphosphocytidyl-2-C-methyl-D-erythritol kinase